MEPQLLSPFVPSAFGKETLTEDWDLPFRALPFLSWLLPPRPQCGWEGPGRASEWPQGGPVQAGAVPAE